MKREFKVGDRVRIRQWDDMVEEFGIDNFGNLICFDANNDKIVFVNHEDMSIEIIADNFNDFLNGLYEL